MGAAYSFQCTACGKCCTSAPLLSVPELFRHQHRFVGALGIRRLRRQADGIGRGNLLAFTTALDHEGDGRCPELSPAGLCQLHEEGKPIACRVVPFDALVPDAAQGLVLDERIRDTEHWDVGCLVRGHLEPTKTHSHVPVFRHLRVVDPHASDALAQHRRVLADEYRTWGKHVVGMLEAELERSPDAERTLAGGGVVTLSLAPVLSILAAKSTPARRRCLDYVEAQLALSEKILRRTSAGETVSAQITAFARTGIALRRALQEKSA